MEIENYEWVDGIYQPKREALQDAIVKLRLDLAQCQRELEKTTKLCNSALRGGAKLKEERDALAEALRNCIPTLEDVAQNQKNMVDFGIVEPGFIQMATRTRDLIEKTMVYIQNALAKLDE